MIQFWAYWLGVGVAGLFTGVMLLFTYSAKNSECRQLRWLLALLVCVASLIAYGGFAFHQTYQLRDDGIHILFGRWGLYAVVVGFFAVNVLSGVTTVVVNYYLAFLLALAHGVALLLLAYTPTNGGSYNIGPLIFWFIVSVATVLALVLYYLLIAFDLQWMWFFAKREHAEEGGATVQSRIWWVLAILAMGVVMLLRCVLAALGPEGWNKYTGSPHNRENVQIWLTLALNDFLMVMLNVVCYIFLDPSGDTNVMRFANIFGPPGSVDPSRHHDLHTEPEHATTSGTETSVLPASEAVGTGDFTPDELMSQAAGARIARQLVITVKPGVQQQLQPPIQSQLRRPVSTAPSATTAPAATTAGFRL